MKALKQILATSVIILFCMMQGFAQQIRNNLIATDDNLVLLIDLRTSVKSIDSILDRAGLKKADALRIKQQYFEGITSQGWELVKRQGNVIEFNRPIELGMESTPGSPYLITVQVIQTDGHPGYPELPLYGINKFSKKTVFEIAKGYTRFTLHGHNDATKVQLSGSFNDWTTSDGIMKRTASGWVYDVKLEPGVYAYKFIIDGHWQRDEANQLTENDGFGEANSIYYRYNYTFKLDGHKNANAVQLAASFLGSKNIAMQKINGIWQISLYLHDGTHSYSFIVDGRRITDPLNKSASNGRSVLNMGQPVVFKLKGNTNARKVCVAGTFNGWKSDELRMRKTRNGWVLPAIIPAGNYGYKFIVDGNWITDPANLCEISEGGQQNSFISSKPNYTFRLHGFSSARDVFVAGTFNGWHESEYKMCRDGDDWTITMRLPAGKIRYKFVADGKWLRDPGNKLWEPNEHGTGNSVVWIN